MNDLDLELNELIAKGKQQGYLTYDEVNEYLPDEAVSPEALDNLLIALDERGIELVDEPPLDAVAEAPVKPGPTAQELQAAEEEVSLALPTPEELRKLTSDPIRMYLSQMAEIPLLSRDEEISLAKTIEITRKRFRRTVLTCHYGLEQTVKGYLSDVFQSYQAVGITWVQHHKGVVVDTLGRILTYAGAEPFGVAFGDVQGITAAEGLIEYAPGGQVGRPMSHVIDCCDSDVCENRSGCIIEPSEARSRQ